MIFDNLIIGTGPTGAVLANQLLKHNKKVAVVDIGNLIEDKHKKIKSDFLKYRDKKNFLNSISQKKILNKYKNPHIKFPFGSEFVYKTNSFESFVSSNELDFVISNAYGGLSNIWGTMVAPFFYNDIKNWDISFKDFYRNKSEAEKIIPISSGKDNLDDFFNINFGSDYKFKPSSSASFFLDCLNEKKDQLNKQGIFFGRSKLALGNYYSYNKVECQECGLCHYGCPYDVMFNSSQVFEQIKDNKNFLYINDKFAEKINYNQCKSNLECIDINTKKKFLYSAKNIFICCGPISTAALLFRSNLVKSDKIIFKESQRFFLPIFNKKNINNSVNQNKNTLSEIYLEIFNEKLLSKSVHLQYYTFIDIILKPLEKYFGRSIYLLPKIFPYLFGRVNLIVGYLHSDYSSKIVMSRLPNDNQGKYRYYLIPEKNTQVKNNIDAIVNFLKDNLKKNFYLFNSLTNTNLTGASYHYGSSLPMSNYENNLKDQTNLNGELSNFKNIFILDSSILPDMPAHPTTFNVCVNAVRIVENLNNSKVI
jgi:choline dehydrogenase-like flavoprotein